MIMIGRLRQGAAKKDGMILIGDTVGVADTDGDAKLFKDTAEADAYVNEHKIPGTLGVDFFYVKVQEPRHG